MCYSESYIYITKTPEELQQLFSMETNKSFLVKEYFFTHIV